MCGDFMEDEEVIDIIKQILADKTQIISELEEGKVNLQTELEEIAKKYTNLRDRVKALLAM